MSTRMSVINMLVSGLNKLDKGEENPFPIPSTALHEYQEWCRRISADSRNYITHYPKFVCAVILGYYDEQIKDWK